MTLPASLRSVAPLCVLFAVGCMPGMRDTLDSPHDDDRALSQADNGDRYVDRPSAQTSLHATFLGDLSPAAEYAGTVTGMVSLAGAPQQLVVSQLQADGSLVLVSEPTNVLADGSYSIDVMLDANLANRGTFIVHGVNGLHTGAIAAVTQLNLSTASEPGALTHETTVEVLVLVDLVLKGLLDPFTTDPCTVDTLLTLDVAAQASLVDDIGPLADVVAAAFVSLDLFQREGACAVDGTGPGHTLEECPNHTHDEWEHDPNHQHHLEGGGPTSEGFESEHGGLDRLLLLDAGVSAFDLDLAAHVAAWVTGHNAQSPDATPAEHAFAEALVDLQLDVAAHRIAERSEDASRAVTGAEDAVDHNDSILWGLLGSLSLDVSVIWDAWQEPLHLLLATELSSSARAALEDADDAAADARVALDARLDVTAGQHTDLQSLVYEVRDAIDAFNADVAADARIEALSYTSFGDDGQSAVADVVTQLHLSAE